MPFRLVPPHLTPKDAVDHIAEAIAGKLGGDWNADRVFGLGLKALMLEKAFNRAAGPARLRPAASRLMV